MNCPHGGPQSALRVVNAGGLDQDAAIEITREEFGAGFDAVDTDHAKVLDPTA
jgi:hypothetical protein